MIVLAKVTKLRIDDGFGEFLDHVEIGKTYRVSTDTRRWAVMQNIPTGKIHRKELIDEYPSGKWLYLELLELGGAPYNG